MEEFNDWLVEWETDAHRGIGKVDHGQGHLAQEKKQLMVKLKAVEVKMEEGQRLRQKLVEILADCEKMKQLPPESKATVFMRKNLRQAIVDTKEEVKKAEKFVNGLGIIAKEKKRKNDEVLLIKLKYLISFLYYKQFTSIFKVAVVASKKNKTSKTSTNGTAAASNTRIAASLSSTRSVSSFRENCFAVTR